jgi:anaerobic magnesium-protoporphyrin IX monomethyl ester cyclase
MKVLMVAPPRRLWPFMNEQDNFLMPQGLACIAAVLREDGVDVEIIDCMPEKVGWKALEQRIRDARPQVVAAGENHATYASEIIRLVELTKSIDPSIVTVLGGGHFTNVGHLYLGKHPIDFIIRAEGEITMRELVRAIDGGDPEAPYKEAGLAYWRDGEVVYTEPRALVENLDDLPLPAYDLMPMRRYGQAKYLFSAGGTTIHHSRGCPARCSFCVWWTQDAIRRVEIDSATGCRQEILAPKWRSKSPERTMEEVDLLARTYDKKCLIFTDPTFNVDPVWSDRFADLLIGREYSMDWFAFMRADFILRDHDNGVMKKLVDSGLAHICIGVERAEDAQLGDWKKKFYSNNRTVRTFEILKTHYPQVFRQATFIVGERDETRESMRAQLEFARLLDPDYPAFHPLTPFPGTSVYDEAVANGWLEIDDFDYFDLNTPVMRSVELSRDEIEAEIVKLNKSYVNLGWFLRGVTSRSRYRRNMYIWWFLVMTRIFAASTVRFQNPLTGTRYTGLQEPAWYRS